jgi:uncharacterized membrane protein YphA (DoxX/SURF4 family)
MGVNRFTRIGFSHPYFTAHFVGTFEIMCGFLILIGLLTRVAAIPLLIVILTVIATTKIPELSHPNQGFWFMVSDARVDFAMLMSLLFLLRAGAGSWSLDAWLLRPAADRSFDECHSSLSDPISHPTERVAEIDCAVVSEAWDDRFWRSSGPHRADE